MIISNEHRFCFVHIPKCAGSSVRKRLHRFHDWRITEPPWMKMNGPSYIKKHPKLGLLYIGHIPLFVLREHFTREFRAVQDYWSFAVVRNPYERFASSVSQRLLEYGDKPIQNLSPKKIRAFIHETIEYLSQQQQMRDLLPADYIHFQRQLDYIELDGERIIDSIYSIDKIDDLFANIGLKTGQKRLAATRQGENTHEQQTLIFRSDLVRKVIDTSRPITNHLSKLLPDGAKQSIYDRVYVHRDERLKGIFEEDHVQAFIRDYYSDDIALYQSHLKTAHS